MSGIYIKGIECPKPKLADMATVYDAYILVSPNGHAAIVVDNEDGLDSTEYPLIPVPDHGRLIDADALGNSLEKLAADKWNHKVAPVNWSYAFEECLEMVDNAPTIIEQNFINAPTIIPADKEADT